MSISPYTIATKPATTDTVVAAVDIPVGVAVTYVGGIAGAGASIYGVNQNENAKAGDYVLIVTSGDTVGKAGAAIATIGQDLAVDSTGRFIPATTGAQIVGRALTLAPAADRYFNVQISKEGVK